MMCKRNVFILFNVLVVVFGMERKKRSPLDLDLFKNLGTKATAGEFLYTPTNGPLVWPVTFPEHCSKSSQSPIDINRLKTLKVNFAPFSFHQFDEIPEKIHIFNKGNTVNIEFEYPLPITALVTGGGLPGVFRFMQAHYHWGSSSDFGAEHTVDGRTFPIELHLVLANVKYNDLQDALGKPDGVAVLGFLFKVTPNPRQSVGSKAIYSQVNRVKSPGTSLDLLDREAFALKDLFVNLENTINSGFYRYTGSLTAPPCTENVIWTVFKEQQELSEADMQNFRNLKSFKDIPMINNYRPPQPLNGRAVYESRPINLKEKILRSLLGSFYDLLARFPRQLNKLYNNNLI